MTWVQGPSAAVPRNRPQSSIGAARAADRHEPDIVMTAADHSTMRNDADMQRSDLALPEWSLNGADDSKRKGPSEAASWTIVRTFGSQIDRHSRRSSNQGPGIFPANERLFSRVGCSERDPRQNAGRHLRAQPVERGHRDGDHDRRAHADRGGFAAKPGILEAEQGHAERLGPRGPEQSRDR